jgi:hypothetical protein
MELNEFERFTKVGGSFAAKMTIRKGGHLGWSQGAAKKFGVDGEGYYAVFYYHKGKQLMGIKITRNPEEEGAVKIQWRKQAGGAVIQCSIRSFLDYYEIDYSETRSYVPELDEPTGLILLRLDNPKESKTKQIESTAGNEPDEEKDETTDDHTI